jgi:uncharacterized protein YkwD
MDRRRRNIMSMSIRPIGLGSSNPIGNVAPSGNDDGVKAKLEQVIQTIEQIFKALSQQIGSSQDGSSPAPAAGGGGSPGGCGGASGAGGARANGANGSGGAEGGKGAGAANGPSATPANASAEQTQALNLINNFRAENGLPPVRLNEKLNAAAQDYSAQMQQDGHFDHTGLDGSQFQDRIKAQGYNMGSGTENIAKGQQSVEEAVQSWIDSAGHRANLLNPSITEIGLGHAGDFWTQEGASGG